MSEKVVGGERITGCFGMLIDGKRHYGDGLYKRAAEITGLAQNTLEIYKHVANQFEFLNRFKELTWKHHREAASIKQIAEDDGKLYLSPRRGAAGDEGRGQAFKVASCDFERLAR